MTSISERIYAFYSDHSEKRASKTLGASMIDSSCERKSYHNYHNKKEVTDGRILRLFETGNSQETRLITDLNNIGLTVTKAQGKLIDQEMPDFGGIPDGYSIIDDKFIIIEIKTHNDKSYKDVVKKGVRLSKPAHFDQIQIYMGLARLTNGLYVAINKNDESIYTESIEFDELHFYYLRDLASRILSKGETLKVSDSKDFFMCKMCQYRDLCHGA